MLQAVLSPLQRVFDVPFKRVVKFAIKSSLGRFLQHDLHFEQFCVSLSSGHAELHELELDAAEICRALGAEDLPFDLVAVRVALVRVEAFGGDEEGLFVHVSGVDIHVRPRSGAPVQTAREESGATTTPPPAAPPPPPPPTKSDEAAAARTKALPADLDLEDPDSDYDDALETPVDSELSQAALDGLNTLGRWIEEYAAGLRIEAVDVAVHVSASTADGETPAGETEVDALPRLVLRCPRMAFGGADPRQEGAAAPLASKASVVERSIKVDEAFVYMSRETLAASRSGCGRNQDAGDAQCIARLKKGATVLLRTEGDQNEVTINVPLVHGLLDPSAWSSFLSLATAFGVEPEGSQPAPGPSFRHAGASGGSAKPPPLVEEAESFSDGLSEFFDADNGSEFSDAVADERRGEDAGDGDLAGWVSAGGLTDGGQAKNESPGAGEECKASPLSIKVVLEELQVEFLYEDGCADLDAEGALRNALDGWAGKSFGSDAELFGQISAAAERDKLTAHSLERLIVRVEGTQFAAGLADRGRGLRANIAVERIGGVELLAGDPQVDPSTWPPTSTLDARKVTIHRVLDMQPGEGEVACHVDLVRGTSMVVQLSALALSWDNGMVAHRLLKYLPEQGTRLEQASIDPKPDGANAEWLETQEREDDERNPEGEEKEFHLRVVSPRALIILRVPPGVGASAPGTRPRRWLSEAMVLDMSDVSAQTGAAARLETISARSDSDSGRSTFYEQVEGLRSIMWSLVLDFARVRAVVRQVPSAALSPSLAPGALEFIDFESARPPSGDPGVGKSPWALVVDSPSEDAQAPRLTVSMRRPFLGAEQTQRTASSALSLARSSRRAFKRRVHQRRAPGEEGGGMVDPAGDHDLDKDQEPPLYEVMEAVSTHGFCTADTAVRLVCPGALMTIDRVQYHSLNTVLQLVLGSLPSFTRAERAELEKTGGSARAAELPKAENEKEVVESSALATHDAGPSTSTASGPLFEPGPTGASFWDDDFDPRAAIGFDSDLDETDEARDRAEVCGVSLSSASGTYFQLCSLGGKVALVDSAKADFELVYTGLELTVVDSKTMAEAQDVTLWEAGDAFGYGEESLRPILHSTKWGRGVTSSPLLQIFRDGSPQLAASNTSVLHVCVDGLTLQVVPQSAWLRKLSDFLTSAPPPGAVEAGKAPAEAVRLEDTGSLAAKHGASVPLVTYTEVTVEFFDAVLEYHSGERSHNMALAGLGMVRMSSNVASPAVRDQSYHLTARDLSLYISNDAPDREEGQFACGPDAARSGFSSIEDFVASMLFAKVASLDMLELFVRSRTAADARSEARRTRTAGADRDMDPATDYEVSVPNLSLYSCTDSFCTLEALVHDFAVELSGRRSDDDEDDGVDGAGAARARGTARAGRIGDNAIVFQTEEGPAAQGIETLASGSAPALAPEQASATGHATSGVPDDELTASDLRTSYLTDAVPDDQLSGPQLRSRHADRQDPDPDAIYVDGFYAVEQVQVVPAIAAASAAAAAREHKTEEAAAGSPASEDGLGASRESSGPPEAAGTWYHIDDDNADGASEDVGPAERTIGALEDSGGVDDEDTLGPTGAELLMWGDPNSDSIEEMELDEWPSAQVGKSRAKSFEEEEAEERMAEAQVQEDTKRAAREQEQAMADFASLYKREFPDQVLQASGDFAILETQSLPQGHTQEDTKAHEHVGGWYEDAEVRVYPHYMGVPFEAGPGSHVPTAEALAARMEGRASLRSRVAPCVSRLVLRDMSVRWFLFGGCDWNLTARTVAQTRRARRRQARAAALRSRAGVDRGRSAESETPSSRRSARSLDQSKRSPDRMRERHELAGRQNDRKLEVVLSHMTALVTEYDTSSASGPCIGESVAIAVRDFSIIDHLSSSDIHTMVGEWISDAQHPRMSGSSMLRVALDRVERDAQDSLCVRASILPVKANLDQDSLEFLLAYLGMRVGTDDAAFSEPPRDGVDADGNNLAEMAADSGEVAAPEGASSHAVGDACARAAGGDREAPEGEGSSGRGGRFVCDDDDEEGASESDDLGQRLDVDSSSEGCLTGEDADIVLVENTDWYIESADVRAFKVKLDYRPKRVNLKSLVAGDRMALVNLFAYEGLQISLRRVELEAIRGGWRELWEHVQVSWSQDTQRQRHRCLAGVSFPPINKVATLGSGLTNLVLMPLEQYQKDGRVVHGLRRGTASFVRTVAIEALGTFSIAAQTAQTLLEHARDVLSPLPPGTEYGGREGLVRGGTDRDGGEMIVGSSGSGGAGSVPPLNMREGMERGADSFTREVKRAAFVLVALPYGELQRTGPTAAVKSVLRGVPIAVIRPLIGATQAVSSTLMGIRNAVDPDARAEEAQKYKSHAARGGYISK